MLTQPETVGERIRIEGFVFDGDRKHIEDALIELWQAERVPVATTIPPTIATTCRSIPAFTGFGRCASDFKTGAYSFLTIKPGPVPHPNGGHAGAAHLADRSRPAACSIPTYTRVYFADEADAPTPPTRCSPRCPQTAGATLIAERVESDGSVVPTYRFDIRYQGDDETVFFDV